MMARVPDQLQMSTKSSHPSQSCIKMMMIAIARASGVLMMISHPRLPRASGLAPKHSQPHLRVMVQAVFFLPRTPMPRKL